MMKAKDPEDLSLTPASTDWWKERYCPKCHKTIEHRENMTDMCRGCGNNQSFSFTERNVRTIWDGEKWVLQRRFKDTKKEGGPGYRSTFHSLEKEKKKFSLFKKKVIPAKDPQEVHFTKDNSTLWQRQWYCKCCLKTSTSEELSTDICGGCGSTIDMLRDKRAYRQIWDGSIWKHQYQYRDRLVLLTSPYSD